MSVLDGIQVTRQIRQYCPSTRVLIFSIYDYSEYVQRALQAGASGYILKERLEEELLDAVRALVQDNQFFGEKIAALATRFTHANENRTFFSAYRQNPSSALKE